MIIKWTLILKRLVLALGKDSGASVSSLFNVKTFVTQTAALIFSGLIIALRIKHFPL